MAHTGRLREIAVATGLTGGSLAVAGMLGVGLLHAQVLVAKRVIGEDPGPGHDDSGRYGAGVGAPYRILVLGDSTSVGVGADSREQTVAAIVATGVAALTGRPVDLTNVGRSGATSLQLVAQADRGLTLVPDPDVVLVMIGANDVKERVAVTTAVQHLGEVVRRMRKRDAAVIVGTCPDLGAIRPIPQPLRSLVQRWSRELAEAQTVAVVNAGGRTVSTGDLLGPAFRAMPGVLFSKDQFHPSSAGYARAAAVLLPSVVDALGILTVDTDRAPDVIRGERIEPLVEAAGRAVRDPGSEVSSAGTSHGRAGPWAQLLRRHRPALPDTKDQGAAVADAADAEAAEGDDPPESPD